MKATTLELDLQPITRTSSEGPPAVTQPVKPKSDLPEEVQRFCRVWVAGYEAFQRFRNEIGQLKTRETKSHEQPFGGLIGLPGNEYINELRQTIQRRLQHMARTAFAVPGSKLEIPENIFENLPENEEESFDPGALWRFLTKKYNSDEGRTQSYTNASKALGRSYELSPWANSRDNEQRTVKNVGGRAVLNVHFYGEWRYNFKAREEITEFLKALKCISMWSGLWTNDQEAQFQSVLDTIENSRDKADARSIGRVEAWPPIILIGFKEKFEVRVAPDLAEQIQVFIATYPVQR